MSTETKKLALPQSLLTRPLRSIKPNVLRCLASLEAVLRRNGYAAPAGAGVDAAYRAYG